METTAGFRLRPILDVLRPPRLITSVRRHQQATDFMNDSPELTAKEKYHAALYQDPARLFRRAVVRKLTFIVPSLALMITWLITRDVAYALCGYGILLYHTVAGIFLAKRGIQTTKRILTKDEAKAP